MTLRRCWWPEDKSYKLIVLLVTNCTLCNKLIVLFLSEPDWLNPLARGTGGSEAGSQVFNFICIYEDLSIWCCHCVFLLNNGNKALMMSIFKNDNDDTQATRSTDTDGEEGEGRTPRSTGSQVSLSWLPNSTVLHLDIYLLCKYTNLKDTAGQSARPL